MPTIRPPKLGSNWQALAEVAMMHRVCAFMLWPKEGDQIRRKAAERQITSAHLANFERKYRSKTDAASEWDLQERDRPAYQLALIRGLKEPWFPELMSSGAAPIAQYVTASLVAYYAIAVSPHPVGNLRRHGAVGVACAIVKEFDGLSRDSKSQLIHCNAQAAMGDWGSSKRAAHFWAAYLVMKVDAPEREPVLDDFRQFIGIARHFRQALRSALIRSTDLLGLPKGYRYRRIERNIELPAELIALLPFYRGDGDLGHRFEKPKIVASGPAK